MTPIRLLFIAFAAFIAFVIRVANTGQGGRYWSFLDAVPFGDKLGHVLLMGTLCLLLNLALKCRMVSVGNVRILLGTILVSLFVVIEELSQTLLPHRTFDLLDLLADAIGIALASGIAVLITRHRDKGAGIICRGRDKQCPGGRSGTGTSPTARRGNPLE